MDAQFQIQQNINYHLSQVLFWTAKMVEPQVAMPVAPVAQEAITEQSAPRLLKLKEVAKILSCDTSTVETRIKEGVLKAIDNNPYGERRQYRVSEEELKRYLKGERDKGKKF